MAARKRKVAIEQGEQKVKPSVLADSVVAVAEGMRRALAGGLTRRAVVVLIQDSVKGTISRAEIEKVLDAVENLDKRYVRLPSKRK